MAHTRYTAEDTSGARVWLEGGMEVHQDAGGKFRCCYDPSRAEWVPGVFDTVDEAFAAGRVAQSLRG